MTREELIEDIKKSVPEIAEKFGDDFNWDRVADMIGKKPVHESEKTEQEEFEALCVYLAYAAHTGLDI